MKIGVLALQGDFIEHEQMVRRLGAEVVEVRLPRDLDGLDGVIMPGGESTTFAKLAVRFDLMEPLRQFAKQGKAVWGTCAGLIFLAKDIGRNQPTLGLMDVKVKRNAFGRQVDSFTINLNLPVIDDGPFPGVFIRAPIIESVGPDVQALCQLDDGSIVAARQGNMLVTSFHPELTQDTRLHAYFLSMADHHSDSKVQQTTSSEVNGTNSSV
jgi:pyridoxal 5'-phosphate synthase pdxT subunit